jgi:hypothetical protein
MPAENGISMLGDGLAEIDGLRLLLIDGDRDRDTLADGD